jgi:hypothetical protein
MCLKINEIKKPKGRRLLGERMNLQPIRPLMLGEIERKLTLILRKSKEKVKSWQRHEF